MFQLFFVLKICTPLYTMVCIMELLVFGNFAFKVWSRHSNKFVRSFFYMQKLILLFFREKLNFKILKNDLLKHCNKYRKRLNNGPLIFYACIAYINRVHACKEGDPLFKRLRYWLY